MCQIEYNELPTWDEAAKMEVYNQLRKEREEQLKKQQLIIAAHIESKVCASFKKSKDDIRKVTRKREIVVPRQVAMALIYQKTKLIEEDIAAYFGTKRDNVNYAKKNILIITQHNRKLREQIEQIERAL